jgi:hypothetical protein
LWAVERPFVTRYSKLSSFTQCQIRWT